MLCPQVRRIAILLRAIPSDADVEVARTSPQGLPTRQEKCRITEVNEMNNCVTFADRSTPIYVPLDRVLTVYKDAKGWRVLTLWS